MNLMNVQVLAKFPLLQALDSTQYKLLLHLPLHHQTTSGGKNLGRESGWALICMITRLVLRGSLEVIREDLPKKLMFTFGHCPN